MSNTLSLQPAHCKPRRSPRRVRHLLIQWWLAILQDCDLLAEAIAESPEGAFTQAERVEAAHALGVVWDFLTNDRPKHHAISRSRRLAWRRRARRIATAAS